MQTKELMPSNVLYPVLSADLQAGFHYRLKAIKELYFHEALSKTVKTIKISDIDFDLNKYVNENSLRQLASLSLRGEIIFPTPHLLYNNPFLVGYYRLLLGFSQKEFYTKGPFGAFRSMEEKGKISRIASVNLEGFCISLISTAESLISQLGDFNRFTLAELQLLTVGPQLRGSMNNEYGQIATQKTFNLIKDLVKQYILSSTPASIEIKNNSGRIVEIKFSADPDIEIIEKLTSGFRGLISIEIKGGKDYSNIHNRIGEAEKSHQKARQRGYFEFMTIISVEIDYSLLKSESPTTSHFFHLDKISEINNSEYSKFKELLSSILGVNI
ncbi:XcyI family restriction endonuclease [Mucilaginibacter glaciei]|uniref:XcyI family restriction endonuclease n=1 Tax=Mucilaginibacter glaciei TaxID=2772109 RepID=A0A926NK94_9SPHI|nr:XcyI family restriction endonuclease [Mucilaginibacter glaciei]MBD1392781.1 XcyI family restriction endonuclease [Mucilaginibacter glaciei]